MPSANGGFTATAPFFGIADETPIEQSAHSLPALILGWSGLSQLLMAIQRLMTNNTRRLKGGLIFCILRQGNILDNGHHDHESLVPTPRPLPARPFII